MKYFDQEYLNFFKELAGNNHKEWFDSNKKRYEKSVKAPFENFVGALIDELANRDEKLKNLMPKDAIFRIYKDVRFSKDKTPYKIQMSAVVSDGGRKGMLGGMYVELGPEYAGFYMGSYMPEKEQLQSIRTGIAKHAAEFEKLLNDKKFKAVFGEIKGEKNAKLPPELKEVGATQPLIYNKQFYFFTELDPEITTSDSLLQKAGEIYDAGKPMSDFLFGLLRQPQ